MPRPRASVAAREPAAETGEDAGRDGLSELLLDALEQLLARDRQLERLRDELLDRSRRLEDVHRALEDRSEQIERLREHVEQLEDYVAAIEATTAWRLSTRLGTIRAAVRRALRLPTRLLGRRSP